jgi:hypothetical protein
LSSAAGKGREPPVKAVVCWSRHEAAGKGRGPLVKAVVCWSRHEFAGQGELKFAGARQVKEA